MEIGTAPKTLMTYDTISISQRAILSFDTAFLIFTLYSFREMGLYSMVDVVTINMCANFHSNIFNTFEVI